MSDLRWREGAACVWSVVGAALAEGGEWTGRGGEGGGTRFGDVEDVERAASAGLDLRAG